MTDDDNAELIRLGDDFTCAIGWSDANEDDRLLPAALEAEMRIAEQILGIRATTLEGLKVKAHRCNRHS